MVVSRFDAELFRHLRPVKAPEALWDRIQEVSAPERQAPVRWPVWAFAAAVAATIALFCFSLRSDTTPYMAKLAAAELDANVERVDFRSEDPVRIRAWVKANTGTDVPLPAQVSVRLIGANLIGKGTACISYRIGNQVGKLVVARGASAAPQHASIEYSTRNGASVASWTMQGQTYALAWSAPGDMHSACILCHLDAAARKASPRA